MGKSNNTRGRRGGGGNTKNGRSGRATTTGRPDGVGSSPQQQQLAGRWRPPAARAKQRHKHGRRSRRNDEGDVIMAVIRPDEIVSYDNDDAEPAIRYRRNKRRGNNDDDTTTTSNTNRRGASSSSSRRARTRRGAKSNNNNDGDTTTSPTTTRTSSRRRRSPAKKKKKTKKNLAPLNQSIHSIHRPWMKDLGGLIRFYVNHLREEEEEGGGTTTTTTTTTTSDVNAQVEAMYYENQCDVERTKEALIRRLDDMMMTKKKKKKTNTRRGGRGRGRGRGRRVVSDDDAITATGTDDDLDIHRWIGMSMIVETKTTTTGEEKNNPSSPDDQNNNNNKNNNRSRAGRGIKLDVVRRPGEGPAHAHETFQTSLIPSWAIEKSYHVEVINRSPLDLSCEMTIDGHDQVAKNAPLPAYSTRTIKPDCTRYFESHKWVLKPAQRVPLSKMGGRMSSTALGSHEEEQTTMEEQQRQQGRGRDDGPPSASATRKRTGKRYNGKRSAAPDNDNTNTNPTQQQQRRRVDPIQFPDPTMYGWTFTGSCQESRVEFYEKKINMGLVLLDFYYTTATIKTVLDHPSTGRNELFRRCVVNDAEQYKKILENPRAHTNLGYRRRHQQGSTTDGRNDDDHRMMMPEEEEDDMDDELMDMEAELLQGEEVDKGPAPSEGTGDNTKFYYAKNDTYNFQEEGHTNRQRAMEQLEPTTEFKEWEKAVQKDWACIHAKFYVSLKEWTHPRPPSKTGCNTEEPLEIPPMTPVIDVKASEKARFATKFESTGPRVVRPSPVRMERIHGLNDKVDWKSGPVFEYKLYYRAQEEGDDDDNNKNMSDDNEEDDDVVSMDDGEEEDDDGIPLAEKLQAEEDESQQQQLRLDTHRTEVERQVARWHADNAAVDREEAATMLASTIADIRNAMDMDALMAAKTTYWTWHEKQIWARKCDGARDAGE